MTMTGAFEIEGSFNLSGHGLLVYGDIISGTVKKNNYFTFINGQRTISLKIKGVDFIDKMKENITKIGLTFHYENNEQMEDLQTLQVTKQTATITEL
jgi:selenocysteine-specific translation elongation factor